MKKPNTKMICNSWIDLIEKISYNCRALSETKAEVQYDLTNNSKIKQSMSQDPAATISIIDKF